MAEQRAFKTSAIAGLISIVLVGVLLVVYPVQVPSAQMAFLPPALALQFALTPQDVLAVFKIAGSLERAEVVRDMRAGDRVDYVFMAAYGVFLSFFFIGQAHKTGLRAWWAVVPMIIVAIAFDVLENSVLHKITEAPDGREIVKHLTALHLYSWGKWSVLAVTSAVAAMSFFYRGAILLGLMCIAPVAIVLPAYGAPGRLAVFLVVGIALSWAVMLAHAIKRAFFRSKF